MRRTLSTSSRDERPGPKSVAGPAMADFDIEVFYDGACPFCTREMRMLRSRGRRRQLRFIDISDPVFDSGSVGLSWNTLMDRIHARLPDGTIVEGVEVYRRLYSAIGFGPLVAMTRLPGLRQLLDLAYRVFAKNRFRLAGRCMDGACGIDAESGSLSANSGKN